MKPMTFDAAEFIRRFFLHILPSGFLHSHYGFPASVGRAATIDRLRKLVAAADPGDQSLSGSDNPQGNAADRDSAPAQPRSVLAAADACAAGLTTPCDGHHSATCSVVFKNRGLANYEHTTGWGLVSPLLGEWGACGRQLFAAFNIHPCIFL